MKVLHILHELKFSGAEIMYVDAASVFQEKGCELTVMATAIEKGEYTPFFEKAGYKTLHWPLPPLKNYLNRIKFYFAFVKLIRLEKYDVVHIHSSGAMWGLAMCAWIAKIRSVYTFHNVFPTRFLTYPYHCLLRWSAKYIFKCRFQTISDSVYSHELNFYHNATIKIYNWYGNQRYYPATSDEKLKARLNIGLDENSFIIISVGGCSPIKRHSEIIKALPVILKEIPNCIYLHLGKGVSESEEIQLAEELGVSKHIMFCGNQTDVRKYLIASDVYLMPSQFEGIPITTIEAMGCKITCILYDVPGLRDFNKTGVNCFLIKEDFNFLADKIRYVHDNPVVSNNIAIRAYEFVTTFFNMQSNAGQIFDLYKS